MRRAAAWLPSLSGMTTLSILRFKVIEGNSSLIRVIRHVLGLCTSIRSPFLVLVFLVLDHQRLFPFFITYRNSSMNLGWNQQEVSVDRFLALLIAVSFRTTDLHQLHGSATSWSISIWRRLSFRQPQIAYGPIVVARSYSKATSC